MRDRNVNVDEYVDEALTFENWTTALADKVLLGNECEQCGKVMTTPKAGCIDCGARELRPRTLPTTGEVYSETGVTVAPKGFESGYNLALIELDDTDGARILARLDSDADIGDAVELVDVFEAAGTPSPVFG